ncbi:MAG: Gfo/Idh/MocA family oxidoreductase [Ferruginibacter sp.]
MKKINWGIIGCGDVTEVKSGPAFNKVNNSSLVAVMRRDAAKAADYAQRHHVPKWYSDADELINDPEVNAIYVATPPAFHEQYAIAAINAGKPVYVEKPMAISYESACKMAAASTEKNIPLVVAHYRRQQPRFKKLHQLILEKTIGDILLVRLDLQKPPTTEVEMANPGIAWRINPTLAGGGHFHDLATHQLDLMYYFFGPVKKVTGIATNQGATYDADDLVAGNLLFESGVAFSGTWCFNAPKEVDYCEIIGTKGKITFSIFNENTLTVSTGELNTVLTFDTLLHVQQPMIEATVQYFLGEGPNPCTAEEGTEVMRLMQEMVAR